MEPRNEKKSRFQIEKLEERIAPSVSLSLGDGIHATGSLNVTTGAHASATVCGTIPAAEIDGCFTSP